MDTINQTKIQSPKLKQPPRYQVVLLNDDYTPMDFVVITLRNFFGMNIDKATRVMMQIHTEGKGICGVYDKDIAETLCSLVNKYSRENQHILKSIIEKID